MSELSPRAEKEEKVLQFWKEHKIFEKSLEKEAPKGEFVFYEGPPGANGRPGIHHMESRFFKDAIPRYKTMQGYHVPRKAGWDTHGLPVELTAEKLLGIQSKKDIEAYGIEKFNAECKRIVWEYVDEWEKLTDRIGFWLDFKNAYVTYHNSYIEKAWGVVKHVEDRNLLYKDYKVLPWCPRCGTALSSHELALGYQDVKDISLYVKFKIKDFPNAYFLAWTTTPWTLPGNVALAVGKYIDYVEVKVGEEIWVLAKERLSILSEPYEIVAEHKGEEMVGMEYEPLYAFSPRNENSHKVYTADLVTTTDGTGIVHTAVMYGQDDFVLGNEVGLPKHHLVDETAHFKPEVEKFAGLSVIEESTAVEILKDLQERNLLYKKESYTHSYPFCWRCKTRLIYYARDSWYIAMSKLRDDLVKENEKINWEPDYIKEGRFGEWLREIKDWAISRERYWGTPLPVWENSKKDRIVVDSLETLKKYSKKNGNKFYFVRHGEAEHNVRNICSSKATDPYHLTEKGRGEAKDAGSKISHADAMYVSPFIRTKETAEIIADTIGFDKSKLKSDDRLIDFNFGEFDGKSYDEYLAYESEHMNSYDTKIPGGESYLDAKKRFGDFLYDIDAKHKNETIVVVTHGIAIETSTALIEGADMKRSKEIIDTIDVVPGQVFEFKFIPLPHNENYELDLHRPYIDQIVLEKDGEEYRRVKEVMDVWFDSGAMPFATESAYPADFISEGIDQTRGWFYTLHAVGVLMEKGRAFKNVICLGLILDKEGKKMSKSVGNVVDPWSMIEKYGVDTLRLWMYSVNQPGENKNFDERTVEEVNKRIFNLLDNVYSFYELFRDKSLETKDLKLDKPHVLDLWILEKLDKLTEEVTNHLDNYKLLEPVRDMRGFIDDLSTWYVRRSRERIKDGDASSKTTLYFVLKRLAHLLASFAPFAAEDLYQKLKTDEEPLSIHLSNWPEVKKSIFSLFSSKTSTLEKMEKTRELITQALEQRQKANIKVRQPLRELKISTTELGEEYLEIIKDELNVKKVTVDGAIQGEVLLDTGLDEELIEEGKVRDVIRAIQDWRKEQGLKPGEVATYSVKDEEKEFFAKHKEEIMSATSVEF